MKENENKVIVLDRLDVVYKIVGIISGVLLLFLSLSKMVNSQIAGFLLSLYSISIYKIIPYKTMIYGNSILSLLSHLSRCIYNKVPIGEQPMSKETIPNEYDGPRPPGKTATVQPYQP
jgi:hypothetical protein